MAADNTFVDSAHDGESPRALVVLVGGRRALAQAVHTEGAGRRYTALAERLRRGKHPAAQS